VRTGCSRSMRRRIDGGQWQECHGTSIFRHYRGTLSAC
jgi:hypothetical protein